MSIELLKEVQIAGKRVVLVADTVASSPPDTQSVQLEPSTDEHLFIYAKEPDIAKAREVFPGLPVYGVWQVALANKLIDLRKRVAPKVNHGLAVIRTSFNGGVYLVTDPSKGSAFDSGLFVGTAIIDAAIDVASPDDGQQIDLLRGASVLPKSPAVLPRERRAEAQRIRRSGMLVAGGVCAGIAIVGGLADWFLYSQAEARKAEAARLNDQARAVQTTVDSLRTQVDPMTPDAKARVYAATSRAMEFVMRTLEMQLIARFEDTQWTAQVSRLPVGMSFPTYISSRPGARTTVTFSTDGVTPIDPARAANPEG